MANQNHTDYRLICKHTDVKAVLWNDKEKIKLAVAQSQKCFSVALVTYCIIYCNFGENLARTNSAQSINVW